MGKQARTHARELRRARQQAARRRRHRVRLIGGVGGLVILGLVVAIAVVIVNAASTGGAPRTATGSAATAAASPAGATAGGAIAVGPVTAPVTLEVYLDYLCPYCGRFERANGGEMARLVGAGRVRLELHPLAFLDRESGGTRYSTRAANAVATVADRAPGSILAINRALYDAQPAEGGGLSDDRIAAVAAGAGVAPDVVARFTDRAFEGWVTAATAGAARAGITGTPTVKVNGVVFTGDLYTTGALTRAIEAAGGR